MQPRQARRSERNEQAQPDIGEHEPRGAAERAEHRALDEQLSRDAAAAGAERRAHREFLAASVRPHEHEVRDVRAGDREHRADRAHQHPERVGDVADDRVLERHERRRDTPVRDRVALGAAGRRRPGVEPNRQHARGVRLRVGERHAGFEPADASQIAEAREDHSAAIELDWQYHLGLGRHVEEAESGGHYADDFRGTRIDRHAPADDARIAAEFPLPIRMGQDHGTAGLENGAGRLRRMVGLGEPTAEHRLNTERLEHAVRHEANPRLLGVADTGHGHSAV